MVNEPPTDAPGWDLVPPGKAYPCRPRRLGFIGPFAFKSPLGAQIWSFRPPLSGFGRRSPRHEPFMSSGRIARPHNGHPYGHRRNQFLISEFAHLGPRGRLFWKLDCDMGIYAGGDLRMFQSRFGRGQSAPRYVPNRSLLLELRLRSSRHSRCRRGMRESPST